MRPRLHFRHEAICRIEPGSWKVVYVVAFDNGMVKVGRTDMPWSRLQAVANIARRRFACEVTDVHLHPTERNWGVEIDALRHLRQIATPFAGTRECFTEITFEEAVELVKQIALTGVQCEELRPDVNWSVLRAKKARG